MNTEHEKPTQDEPAPVNRHQRRKQAANMRRLIKETQGKKISASTSAIARAMKG